MGRLSLALKVLLNGELAKKLSEYAQDFAAQKHVPEKPAKPQAPARPTRSDAITLLATLQREARIVDFLMEPIENYADAQIGAAVRDVHRDSRAVLDRLFNITPVLDQAEGSAVDLSSAPDSSRVRLLGETSGNSSTGNLVHHGWEAKLCALPEWHGSASGLNVIAPAEVEIPAGG